MELSELKAGDTVVYHSGGTFGTKSLKVVEKTTAAQVVLENGLRFRKATGKEVGGDRWSYASIHVPCDTEVEEITQSKTIQSTFNKMRGTKKMSYEMAVELLAVFEKYEVE